ncbi:MAG TPA: CHAT domain-containing protein [Candidatus Angelobacter sp.]
MLLLAGCKKSDECTGGMNLEIVAQKTNAYTHSGELQRALKCANYGLKSSQAKDPNWNYKFRVLKAEIQGWQGENDLALSLLDAPPPPQLANSDFAVRRKDAQGRALDYTGQFAQAGAALAEARQLAEKYATNLVSDVVLDQGTLAFDQANYAEAGRLFREAVKLAEERKIASTEVSALEELGRLATRLDHFDEAIDWHKRALAVAQGSTSRGAQEASILSNLGWSYLELGDAENAIANFEEAGRIAASQGQTHVQTIGLVNVGRIHFERGEFDQAKENWEKACTITTDASEDKAICEVNLGALALALDHPQEAKSHSQQGRTGLLKSSSPNSYLLMEFDLLDAGIATRERRFADAEKLLNHIVRETPAESQRWAAEAELANVYKASGSYVLAEHQFQKTLDTLDSAWKSLSQLEQKLAFSSRAAGFYKDYVDFLVERKRPDAALQVAERIRVHTLSEGLHQSGTANPGFTVAEAKAYLGARHQVVLAYWFAPKRSFLWLIGAGQLRSFDLPSRKKIELLVRDYNDALMNGRTLDDDSAARLGTELYQTLVAPAAKYLPRQSQVVIIPDGDLARLNFETLVVPGKTPHYWIEDAVVENASSVSLLVKPVARRKQYDKQLLIMGNPNLKDTGFPPLENANAEIQGVAGLFPAAQVLIVTGDQATPSAYTALHPERARVLYFVTHGVSNQVRPLDSAIILSKGQGDLFKLYGSEIVKTKLNAELVMISACGSAGRTYGEGPVGLAWAFMRAGAHQVIAALWNVNDAVMPHMMKDVFSGVAARKKTAEALREAKLAMLHDKSHPSYQRPYYWASLQLYTGY